MKTTLTVLERKGEIAMEPVIAAVALRPPHSDVRAAVATHLAAAAAWMEAAFNLALTPRRLRLVAKEIATVEREIALMARPVTAIDLVEGALGPWELRQGRLIGNGAGLPWWAGAAAVEFYAGFETPPHLVLLALGLTCEAWSRQPALIGRSPGNVLVAQYLKPWTGGTP